MTENDLLIAEKRVRGMLAELSPYLTYHNSDHTFDVLAQCIRIAKLEGIVDNSTEMMNLRMAALYHDTGFLEAYTGHEQVSCRIFTEDTTDLDISTDDRAIILNIILATRLPQKPKTILEKVICDSDLDYLGREDFFSGAENLKKEFLHYGFVKDDDEWDAAQLKFLSGHHYHTQSSVRLREPVKQQHLQSIRSY